MSASALGEPQLGGLFGASPADVPVLFGGSVLGRGSAVPQDGHSRVPALSPGGTGSGIAGPGSQRGGTSRSGIRRLPRALERGKEAAGLANGLEVLGSA